MEYWKDRMFVKPLALTSTQTCSPQLAVAWFAEKVKALDAFPSSPPVLSSSPVVSQLTATVPLLKLGTTISPCASITSMAIGVSENATAEVAVLPPTSSKQISKIVVLSASEIPVVLESSQPILAIPGVAKLKLAADKSPIPKD